MRLWIAILAVIVLIIAGGLWLEQSILNHRPYLPQLGLGQRSGEKQPVADSAGDVCSNRDYLADAEGALDSLNPQS